MVDTAIVANEMWDKLLQQGTRHYWSEQIGLKHEQARKYISFWVGLHDIGKASPAFQNQTKDNRHDILTAYILKNQFKFDKQIAVTLGGHHGIFPRSEELISTKIKKDSGSDYYYNIRQELFNQLEQICGMDQYKLPHPPQTQAFFMFLAGLTSVADWIASNETFFPLYDQKPNIEQQLEDSRKHASEALWRLDWSRWQPLGIPGEFNKLFPDIKEIRPLQKEIIALAARICHDPGLVIIEAPTGEGKTEAAIYIVDAWNTCIGQKGCYFALPTQATSNQMFGRFGEYLGRRYPEKVINYLLLHGHAALSSEFQELRQNDDHLFEPGMIYDNCRSYDKVPPNIVASEWFTHRKRGLLAPFGLGTIDQGLLAVLQTRHVFVRLFGLAGKTIIIDEVHAYDAYMTTLLERLLEWLAALGSSVILLSATLPKSRRDGLMEAYHQGLNIKIERGLSNSEYPRISWLTANESGTQHIETSLQSTRKINLKWVDGNIPEEPDISEKIFPLGTKLQKALSEGGCAAVICNTVDHAQKMYQALKHYFSGTADDGLPELDLLHSRFLWGDRSEHEKRSLVRYGKPDSKVKFDDGTEKEALRPNRAVLVATQIIEQSLDLDFDLMVTEMAPVDLLLQRGGRLQRHNRPERKCNAGNPTLWICLPGEKQDGTPDFGGGTEAVYERHILLRSWLEIKDRISITVPGEVEQLIETVYGDQECPPNESENLKRDWKESSEKLKEQFEYEQEEAKERWIKKPSFDGELWKMTYDPREEDDPGFHPDHQALTRLTGLTISILCLQGDPNTIQIDGKLVDINKYPSIETAKKLLNRSVNISQHSEYGIVNLILEKEKLVPEVWRNNPLLRHHYLMYFDENKRHSLDNYEFYIDAYLGLIIKKNKA